MTPAVLPRESAAEYIGLSVPTFELLVRQAKAPAPRQLSGRRVGWLRSELDAWAEALPVSDLPPGPTRRVTRSPTATPTAPTA